MSLLALMAEKFEVEHPDVDAGAAEHDTAANLRLVYENDLHTDMSPSRHADVNATKKKDSSMTVDDTSNDDPVPATDATPTEQEETKLLITFLLMVIVGTANKIFQKLQAIPMYNYPNSLNLLQK